MVPLPYEQVRRSGGLSGAKIAVTAQGCGLWWFGSDKGCHHSSYAVASVNLPINNYPSSVAAVVNSTRYTYTYIYIYIYICAYMVCIYIYRTLYPLHPCVRCSFWVIGRLVVRPCRRWVSYQNYTFFGSRLSGEIVT